MWQNTLTIMVRTLINDMTIPYKYADSRIEQAIVVAALQVAQEYDFTTNYTFNIATPDIVPDPTVTATLDNEATALFGLKAASILDINNYQNAVKTGIKVRDGNSQIDLTSGFGGYKDILTYGPYGAYQKLLASLSQKKSMNIGKAVTSPASTDITGFYGTEFIFDFYNQFR